MLRDRFKSFVYAFKGIQHLLKSTPNARIHAFFALAVVVAGIYFKVSPMEWCFLVGSIAAVFSAESFNTALEELTDLVSPEVHPLAGKAKDLAAGAVLFTAAGAVVIGLIIFIPKLLALL